MPPALVMAIETLELSPLFSTKVPPARTGLAVTPMLLKPTKVPAVMFEIVAPLLLPLLLLPLLPLPNAVTVKLQMPDARFVLVRVYEYPFEVPLKVESVPKPSCVEDTPLRTSAYGVPLTIDEPAERLEMPNVIGPAPPLLADNLP